VAGVCAGVCEGVCWADKLIPSPNKPTNATTERRRFINFPTSEILVCGSQKGYEITL
jgi:hypothetical protein